MEAVRVRVTALGLACLTASCPVSLRSLSEGQKENPHCQTLSSKRFSGGFPAKRETSASLMSPPWHPIQFFSPR